MLNAARSLVLLPVLLWGLLAAHADPVAVHNLRLWHAPDHTRLVFDLSGPLEHRLFPLKDPPRLVVDLSDARLEGSLPATATLGPRLAAVRAGQPEAGVLRVVLDLKGEVQPRSFVLRPAGQYGHRLVIDLYDAAAASEDHSARPADPGLAPSPPGAPPPPRRREFVIAIDAGHGGEDPGAIGRRYGTREKDVTLAIARDLARLVAQEPGMRAVLTRDGDYYIGLRERFMLARRHRADVFVSIHADAAPHARAYGSSVYVLSERGASHDIARFLADRENASDLIGGVSLSDKDELVAKVLVDLSRTSTIQEGVALGEEILAELRRIGPVHLNQVAQAGFAVLKAPDIPSVLVETAFLSNPSEERKLRTRAYQRQVAQALFSGLKRYLARVDRAPVQIAEQVPPRARVHVVQPGETLAAIARRYNVDIDVLRFANDLMGEDLPAGVRLRIP